MGGSCGKGWSTNAGCNEGVWEEPEGQAKPSINCCGLLHEITQPQPLHWVFKVKRNSLAHLSPSTLCTGLEGPDCSYIKKSACLHGPHKDLKGVLRSCRDDFPTRVNSHTGELCGAWRSECAEIPVPEQKMRSR